MKNFSHIFQGEINRLEASIADKDIESPDTFLLKLLKDMSNTTITDIDEDLYRCLKAWPCMKTMLTLMMWITLKQNERREK